LSSPSEEEDDSLSDDCELSLLATDDLSSRLDADLLLVDDSSMESTLSTSEASESLSSSSGRRVEPSSTARSSPPLRLLLSLISLTEKRPELALDRESRRSPLLSLLILLASFKSLMDNRPELVLERASLRLSPPLLIDLRDASSCSFMDKAIRSAFALIKSSLDNFFSSLVIDLAIDSPLMVDFANRAASSEMDSFDSQLSGLLPEASKAADASNPDRTETSIIVDRGWVLSFS